MLTSIAATFAPELSTGAFYALVVVSYFASLITVALGIGGGAIMLTVMASLMPPLALIPVHGAVQLGSNVTRAAVFLRHVQWSALGGFAIGTLAGIALGGSVAVSLSPGLVQVGVGLFVIWSVLAKPPKWLSRLPWLTGGISSFLTMFFGATGTFVAAFTKSLMLPKEQHVGTHAALMTMQHGLKVVMFAVLGVAFGPWILLIGALLASGFLGTLTGRLVLGRIPDAMFKRALDAVLVLVSLRLIWVGLTG